MSGRKYAGKKDKRKTTFLPWGVLQYAYYVEGDFSVSLVAGNVLNIYILAGTRY